MKIQVGDVIGLGTDPGGYKVIGIGPRFIGRDLVPSVLLQDGRYKKLSDVFLIYRPVTETFSDGRVRVIGEEEL